MLKPTFSFICVIFLFIRQSLGLKCALKSSLDQSCIQSNECVSGLYCDYNSRKCTKLPQKNEECGNGIFCDKTLGCSSSTNKCIPLALDNEECLLTETGPNLCAPQYGCYFHESGINKCSILKGKIGDLCTVDNKCEDGNGCDYQSNGENRCIALKKPGETCSNNFVCQNGFCDFSNLKCVAKKNIDQNCKYGECIDSLSCLPKTTFFFFTKNVCQNIPNNVGNICNEKCGNNLICK